jgi:hypothetical protein
MRLIGVQQREVVGLFEISSKDVKLLLDALDHCEINIDENNLNLVNAKNYFIEVFVKQMISFEEALEKDYGIRSDTE